MTTRHPMTPFVLEKLRDLRGRQPLPEFPTTGEQPPTPDSPKGEQPMSGTDPAEQAQTPAPKFECPFCGREFPTKQKRAGHQAWCPKNPNRRTAGYRHKTPAIKPKLPPAKFADPSDSAPPAAAPPPGDDIDLDDLGLRLDQVAALLKAIRGLVAAARELAFSIGADAL